MERFCDKCGTLVNSDGGFCPMCGAAMPAVVDLRKPTAGGNMPEAGNGGANYSSGLGTADYRIDDDPLGLRNGSDNTSNQNNTPTYVESSYNGSYNSSDNSSGSYNGSYNSSNNYNGGSYNSGNNSSSGCGCSGGFAPEPGEVTVNMSTLQWVGTILLGSCLGIISIIILIYWAFGGTTAQPKKNYARAALIIQVAGFVLSFLLILLMFVMFGADFWESIPY